MGFSSQAGQLILRTQSVPGTFQTDIDTAGVAIKLKSGSFGTNRELLIPDPEIGGGRDVVDAYLGAVVWAGDFEFYTRIDGFLTLLYAALGTKASASQLTSGTAEVQTLTESGTISGGTYTITWAGSTTEPLAFDATASTVQTALNKLSSIYAVGGVAVTGGPVQTTALTITFNRAGARAAFTVGVSQLTGTTPGITVAEGTPGVDGTATGATLHTFTPSDAAQLPFLSVEEVVGNGLEAFHYTDVVVNSLHVESDANGYLSGSVSLIASRQEAGITPVASPLWDNTPMIVGTNINVQLNGVALPAKKFTLDVANNFEEDDFRLGSFYIGDLTPKRREVTASFTLRHASSAIWRQASYGAAAATTPGGVVTKNVLTIAAETYENIPGVTPAEQYGFDLSVPNFTFKPFALEASGDDILENDVEGQALRPIAQNKLLTLVAKTNKATVA